MTLNSILIVDDSSVDREIVSIACRNLDCEVEAVESSTEALEKFKASRYSLVLTDYVMEPIDGLDLIKEIREINPDAICLIMTGYPDARLINFMNEMEMSNIITKPIRPAHLTEQLRVALNQHRGATQQLGEIALSNRMDRCVVLLGHSDEICQVRKEIVQLSSKLTPKPLFIEGPFGIGKPDIIKFIHQAGPYAGSNIVFCPCKEMTREEFEEKILSAEGEWGTYVREAEHGTLVFDHVEAIPLELQSVLAKHLKSIAENCRVIASANAMIDDLLNDGKIDMELYCELTLETIHLPALSERSGDIEEIVRFIAASPADFGLTRKMESMEIERLVVQLKKSDLRGNLRELIEQTKAACIGGVALMP